MDKTDTINTNNSDISSLSFQQKYEEEWNSLYLCKNIDELRRSALEGRLRASRFRSVLWRVLLKVIPEDSSKWLEHLQRLRLSYSNLKEKLSCNPWNHEMPNDDPLSQDSKSLWNKHFCDEELRSVIKQDVVRTFPGVDFFRKLFIQEIMVAILFTYAREHKVMCYRQGMHELLGPLLFVLHCDHQAMLHTGEQIYLNPIITEILNPAYIEEDGYYLFSELMRGMQSCYHINNVAPTATGYFPASLSSLDSPADGRESENEVVSQLNIIRDQILKRVDPELTNHLKNLDITLPLFGIRWLRLLFGREFHLQDLLVLWDAIFSQGTDFKFVHYIVVAMLVAIRKQLLEGDYTSCLMYLMRYPTNIDVTHIIEYGLHLQNPKVYESPRIYTEIFSSTNVQKKVEKPKEIVEGKKHIAPKRSLKTASRSQSKSNFYLESSSSIELDDPDKLAAELKHARDIMSVTRIKLLQYHAVLSKAITTTTNENNRDAMLALDGIYQLCNLLTSRYFTHYPDVEDAVEAGEMRPTELNLKVNATTKPVPKKKTAEMQVYARTEGVSSFDMPMIDPTRKSCP